MLFLFIFAVRTTNEKDMAWMNKNVCVSKGCPYLRKKTEYYPMYAVKYFCTRYGSVTVDKMNGCPLEKGGRQ